MTKLRDKLAKTLKLETAHYALAYKANSDQVAVGPWPDQSGWSKGMEYFCLGFFKEYRSLPFQTRSNAVIYAAFHAITMDKVNPEKLHVELLKLREYRDSISDELLNMQISIMEA